MWQKIGDFSLHYIGFCFSYVGSRQIRYENAELDTKISKISFSTGETDSDPFRMIITTSTTQELQNLQNLFKNAKLIFGTFGSNELYFDVSGFESFKPFFKVIQTFEPTIVQLEAELTRKYNRDYTDYPLIQAPPALVEPNPSLKNLCHDEVNEILEQGSKCLGEDLRSSERVASKLKVG